MWFHHDGAPPHFSRRVRKLLNQQFPEKWIGRGGPLPWPAPSPDLNLLDFLCVGEMRNLVCKTPVESDGDLVARIVAAVEIKVIPAISDRVPQFRTRRSNLF